MPLHAFIKQIYKDCGDDQYFLRFLDYIITNRGKRPEFYIQGYSIKGEILVQGVIKNEVSNSYYDSLHEYYNSVTDSKIERGDLELFKKIHISREFSLYRALCGVKEPEILQFVDQKYRSHLIYNDLRKRISCFAGLKPKGSLRIFWNDTYYNADKYSLVTENEYKPDRVNDFMDEYDRGAITGLFYVTDTETYAISDS
jgi:hypothetical protein